MPKLTLTFNIKLKVLNKNGEYVDCTYSEDSKGELKIEKTVEYNISEVKVADEILGRYNSNLTIKSNEFSLPDSWVPIKSDRNSKTNKTGNYKSVTLNYDNNTPDGYYEFEETQTNKIFTKYYPSTEWLDHNYFTNAKSIPNGIKITLYNQNQSEESSLCGIEMIYTEIGGIKTDKSFNVYLWQGVNSKSTSESYINKIYYTLPETVDKVGFKFNHWRKNYEGPSNTWVGHYGGATVELVEGSTKFLARYSPSSFNLNYNLNNGNLAPGITLPTIFTYGTPVDFTNNIIRKDIYRNGYTFNGFEIESGSGTFGNNYNPYIPNCIYNSDGISDTTIRATWEPNTYKITYKLNYKKPIPGTYNTIDIPVKFFNGSRTWGVDKPYPFGEYKPDGSLESNRWIWPLTASLSGDSLKNWLTGYEYTLNTSGGLNYNNAVDSGSWKKGIVTSGTSTIGQYGDLTLTLDVIPKNYEITYTEGSPRLEDRTLIKTTWNQKNVEIEPEPELDLPTSYTILDDPKDLFNTRLLKEDKSAVANIETNKLKLGLDRGLYYNGNLKSKDNYSFLKLTENNKGINGPYQDYGKLYFTQEYKLSKFKFRFNYKYNGDEYPSIDSDEFEFMGGRNAKAFSNPFSNINLTLKASNNFTFDGWVDSVGVKVIDKVGNITNNSNKELKYFWGKKNSNNQYTYYLIAEKNEDPNNPRIIDLYPKWVRQTGVKVFDGKEWQYPTENGNTNVDGIKINNVDWNNIKEMKVYDGTEWKLVNLNHRPPDPTVNIYEEM